MKSKINIKEGEEMEKYFWLEETEPAHIVENEEPAENPCGNDGQHYVAFCRKQGDSWTMKKVSGHIFASGEQMNKLKKTVCPICQEIRTNIKVQKALLSR